MFAKTWAPLLVAALCSVCVRAQIPPPPANRLPPAGIAIAAAERAELTAGAEALGRQIESLRHAGPALPGLPSADLADIEIFHKAVDWALRYDEFFNAAQIDIARHLLAEGRERAEQWRQGRAPWLTATGRVIRGYRSHLDGSVQPYALVLPTDGAPAAGRRLDVVLSGRDDKRTELAFIAEHERSSGEIVPAGAIVLFPYGRFCNATKFAGEVDVFEAMAAVRAAYPVDPQKRVVRGFSMGGASAWHLAAHNSGLWCAASPGAGFAETGIYTRPLNAARPPTPGWERKLWTWYDATACAGNFFNCPTVAYSGEIDPQKQSADIMERAMAAEHLKLERLIGPKTGHRYHPETKAQLAQRLDALVAQRPAGPPREVRVTAYTLRYGRVAWVEMTGLAEQWVRSDIRALWDGATAATLETRNVTSFKLDLAGLRRVTIDAQEMPLASASGAAGLEFHRNGERWFPGPLGGGLRKRRDLTGPVDDAFMSAFVFVRPTGQPLNPRVGSWVGAELAHASKMWRDTFRGDAPVTDDTAVNDADIAGKNLVLWGDPQSNALLARLLGRLPLKWDAQRLVVHGVTYDAGSHVPILIFPNPLNPRRYVVIDSGMDFRDDAYGTNALQTPKLPDWTVVDLRTPPGARWPGAIAAAGFFNEEWQ